MLQAELIRETLAGYARANEVIEDERMERFAHMTPEESRAIYDDLVEGWHPTTSSTEMEWMDLWRAETLVAIRHALDRLAKAQRTV